MHAFLLNVKICAYSHIAYIIYADVIMNACEITQCIKSKKYLQRDQCCKYLVVGLNLVESRCEVIRSFAYVHM